MCCWLHGPYEGRTININGFQFTDGKCEEPLHVYLERYYGAKDYPPNAEKNDNTKFWPELDEVVDEICSENEVTEESVEEVDVQFEAPYADDEQAEEVNEDWKSMPFFKLKAYIKKVKGVSPKNKKEAFELMGESL